MDSRDVIVTDTRHTQAAPLFPQTYSQLAATIPPLAQKKVVVMGGFIGATEEGVTSTLGRGGSDFTAAIVGAGIGAEEIQIWTDVDGMLTADPTVMPGGYRVKTISFAEAAELAYFGAKVLHPATVVPAIEKNIPVLILNSRRPEVEGTLIVSETVHCANVAKSIACKKKITLVNIVSSRMLMAHGFLRRIFEVFDRYETPVDMVATSEVSVSLTIDNLARLKDISRELRQFADVSIEEDQAIVCLVGDNIRHTPGVASRAFSAAERYQHPHDLPRSVAVEPECCYRAGRSQDRRSSVCTPSSSGIPMRRCSRHENRASSATARWASLSTSLRPSSASRSDPTLDEYNNANSRLTRENFKDVDVAIEFSTPQAVVGNIEAVGCAWGQHSRRYHRLGQRPRPRQASRRERTASGWSGVRTFRSEYRSSSAS